MEEPENWVIRGDILLRECRTGRNVAVIVRLDNLPIELRPDGLAQCVGNFCRYPKCSDVIRDLCCRVATCRVARIKSSADIAGQGIAGKRRLIQEIGNGRCYVPVREGDLLTAGNRSQCILERMKVRTVPWVVTVFVM